jgi:hypothetical protein
MDLGKLARCEAEIEALQSAGLLPDEIAALMAIVDAWNAYCKLPHVHPNDNTEVMTFVHGWQNVIMARPAARAMAASVAAPCPFDTNGDGDCGRRYCPHCIKRRAALNPPRPIH